MTGRGVLFLVVGPSGVGKDSLIGAARAALADQPQFLFPRRVITRQDAEGEDHWPVSPEEFRHLEAAGRFALSWQAHGLAYGIPIEAADAQAAQADGRSVVVNVSRSVIGAARLRFPPMRVLLVRAARDVLAARLRARGRESEAEILARLDRAQAFAVEGDDVRTIANDGALDEAAAQFVRVLEEERLLASGAGVIGDR